MSRLFSSGGGAGWEKGISGCVSGGTRSEVTRRAGKHAIASGIRAASPVGQAQLFCVGFGFSYVLLGWLT